MKSRLEEKYLSELAPQLKARLGYDNIMELPRLRKIVLSIGLGEATQEPKALETAEKDLTTISGQHPVTTRAKRREQKSLYPPLNYGQVCLLE